MRTRRPPHQGPVQGKTGNNTSKNNKLPALADRPNPKGSQKARKRSPENVNETPRNPKSEKSRKYDTAFFVEASSADTAHAIAESIKSAIPKAYTPSRMKVLERSPGGGPMLAETTTERKRPFIRERDFRVEQIDSGGEINVCRGLVFFEPSKKAKTTLEAPKQLAQAPLEEKKFSVEAITAKDVKKAPPRAQLKREESVVGEPANKSAAAVLGENTPAIFNICHLAAVCLASGAIDTQVLENLFVGTNRSNWTKKHYELALRKILLNNEELTLKFFGIAKLLNNTNIAVSESLLFEFVDPKGSAYRAPIHFDSLSLVTEKVTASIILRTIIETLVSINKNKAEEKDEPTSAPSFRP